MKTRSLQSKLFFAYISLACLILFSFAVFFYAFVSRQLKQSQISAMNTLNSSFQTRGRFRDPQSGCSICKH